jgi:hypothetical protein
MNQMFRRAALVCQLLIATLTNETHAAPAIPIPGGGGATYPPTSLAVEMVSLPLEHKTNTNNVAIVAVSVSATISTEDIGLKRIRLVFAEDVSTNLLKNLRVYDQFGIVVSQIQQITKIGGKCVADFSVGYNNQQYDIEIIKVYPSYEFIIRADIANDTRVASGITLHASLDPLRPVSAQGLDSGRVASIFYQPSSVAIIHIAPTFPKTGHIDSIVRSGQNVVLSGTLSQTGAYVFEKSSTAINPVWSTIQSGTATTTQVSVTTAAPVNGNMFYRLRLL